MMLVYVLVIARNMSAVLIEHCLMLYSPTRIDTWSIHTDKGSRVAKYASTQGYSDLLRRNLRKLSTNNLSVPGIMSD
jgi:hypothetical protein